MSIRQIGIVNQVLSTIARGYKNPAYVAEYLFPTVYVEKEGVSVPVFSADEFLLYETERAPRADSNVMTPESDSTIDIVLKEHDLVRPVDYREEAASMFNRSKQAARKVTDSLRLKHEMECASLAQDATKYPSGHKIALSSGSYLEELSAPTRLIKEGKEVIADTIGIEPNTMIIGSRPWATFTEHPDILSRMSATNTKIMTEELAAQMLEISKVKVGRATYRLRNGQKVRIWDNSIILAYVPENDGTRSEEEPSFGYTLRLEGKDMVIDEYPSNGGKVNNVRCTDIRKSAILGADAGYLITNVTSTGFTW